MKTVHVNDRYYVGHQIRSAQVLLIDQNNNNCGLVKLSEALLQAELANLDLVQISFNKGVSTCKILDFSKFKYEMSKKDKENRKKQREAAGKMKEIKFRPSTNINDLRVKAKKTQSFLEDGNKVKITIVFKGRELSHKDLANETLNLFMECLPTNIQMLNEPILNGKNLTIMLGKVSEKPLDIAL